LVQTIQELLESLNPVAGLEDLGGLFEQQSSHLAFGQATAQIKKGAVFLARSAMAIGAATFEKALQKGGVQGVGRKGEGAQEMSFTLTQGEGRETFEACLTHTICKIAR
jgi:hypothetical protein